MSGHRRGELRKGPFYCRPPLDARRNFTLARRSSRSPEGIRRRRPVRIVGVHPHRVAKVLPDRTDRSPKRRIRRRTAETRFVSRRARTEGAD